MRKPEPRILLIDDDDSLRRVMEYNLQKEGYIVTAVVSGEEGLTRFREASFDLVITDITMPGMSGMEVLQQVKAASPGTEVIVITAYGTIESAVEAMKTGAADYVTKPFNRDEFRIIVERTLRLRDLEKENRQLRAELRDKYRFEGIIGTSPQITRVLETAGRVAKSDATVLITGESGTGKELLARGIHYNSSRSEGPFVTINCAAIPENLLESELFGHVRGAFTGAVKDKAGKFELAHGGTLFLDEVGELKVEHQAKVLRALQEKEIDRVGGGAPVSVDVRLIAATNRDLSLAMESGEFRNDLYYRLSVITLDMPPLRIRREDIPLLAEHFIAKHGGNKRVVAEREFLSALARYTWPGNVRELENTIERALILRQGETLSIADLPERLTHKGETIAGLSLELPDEGISLEELEKTLLVMALDRHEGNQTKAAKFLGLTRPTLIYRMEKYGIQK
ncbi:MAG: sigma-54 dependent transcriptional regulator [Nitrospirota bacterium]|nr:sigma-54 dependent transcriptional regulator [Nitrospirota bacterium]